MNSDSDPDDDIFLDDKVKVNGETTGDKVNGETNDKVNGGTTGIKFYQLQHKADDKFIFKFTGYYDHEPVVNLGNFNSEGKSFYLESNFVKDGVNETNETNKTNETNLYPMMSIYIYDNGRLIKVVTGIELNIDSIEVDKEYAGTSYIELVDGDHREIIKKGLIFPGSTKIVYFLIRELSNEKIADYINGKRD